jgi:iron complex outermembrane receptor protein
VQNPEFQNKTYPGYIGSYTTWDLYGRYVFDKHWSVSASVLNIFDKTPHYDPGFTTTELYDWSLYDVRGLQARVALTYKM